MYYHLKLHSVSIMRLLLWLIYYYTMSQKNVPPLVCYNFDTRERILIFFGRNVTDVVSSQKRFTLPPQITCASALPSKTEKRENCIFFHSNALPEFIQSLLDIFSLFDSRLILMLLYDSLNLVINAFSWAVGDMVQEKGSGESRSSWTVLHTQCAVFLKEKNVICDVFDSV